MNEDEDAMNEERDGKEKEREREEEEEKKLDLSHDRHWNKQKQKKKKRLSAILSQFCTEIQCSIKEKNKKIEGNKETICVSSFFCVPNQDYF